jgi:uncharacterized UBP type Zn finger protein|tara:strand:+ start:608 stop:1408 length:801 start_codon:yes stop_codon:yes gene_type:complete
MKGIRNKGNTCYFNTALQCLLYIPALSNYMIRKPYAGECTFTRAYSDLVKVYWTKGRDHVGVSKLLEAFIEKFPRFANMDEQHDVQEAVLCIVDILERSVPEIKPWFYGKKTQETVWPTGKSTSEEDFSVHLVTSSRSKDMGQILAKSTDWNVIENYVDDDGKRHNLATTRMVFSELPRVLMISFDKKSHVQILKKLVIGDSQYDLISTAVHVGEQDDGHYVSFVKRKNKWLFINDDHVEEYDPPEQASYYFMVYNLKTPSSQCSP